MKRTKKERNTLTKKMSNQERAKKWIKTKPGALATRYMDELGATPTQAAKFVSKCGKRGKKGNTFGLRRSIVGPCPNTIRKLTEVSVK